LNIEKKQNPLLLDEIQKKLEHYCAYQERCHKEVAQKLKEIGVYGTLIDAVIGKLIEANYLNETRFAESFVRGKFRIKNWGKKRLIRELKIRDISDWNIKNALKEIPDSEYFHRCKALVEKFWVSNRNKSLEIRKKKIWAALQYRGWETELIMENIQNLERQKE
tara:strand:- start:404 stop:895 length:492 start_codon:yes stop_codon:yes gene_type:complete